MRLLLSPEKYASAVKGLLAEPKGGDLKSLTLAGPDAGEIITSQVDLAFVYNGVDALNIVVKSKHGLARWASDATIQSHLEDMLNKVDA